MGKRRLQSFFHLDFHFSFNRFEVFWSKKINISQPCVPNSRSIGGLVICFHCCLVTVKLFKWFMTATFKLVERTCLPLMHGTHPETVVLVNVWTCNELPKWTFCHRYCMYACHSLLFIWVYEIMMCCCDCDSKYKHTSPHLLNIFQCLQWLQPQILQPLQPLVSIASGAVCGVFLPLLTCLLHSCVSHVDCWSPRCRSSS